MNSAPNLLAKTAWIGIITSFSQFFLACNVSEPQMRNTRSKYVAPASNDEQKLEVSVLLDGTDSLPCDKDREGQKVFNLEKKEVQQCTSNKWINADKEAWYNKDKSEGNLDLIDDSGTGQKSDVLNIEELADLVVDGEIDDAKIEEFMSESTPQETYTEE